MGRNSAHKYPTLGKESPVISIIMGPWNVHVLIPEPSDYVIILAKGTLQM